MSPSESGAPGAMGQAVSWVDRLLDISSVAMAVLDASTARIVNGNAAFVALTGRALGELVSLSLHDLMPGEDRAAARSIYEAAANQHAATCLGESRWIRPGGGVVWVRPAVSFVREHDGDASMALVICEDATERRHAESLVRLSSTVLAILNEGLPLRHSVLAVLDAIRQETGLSSAGLRLKDGDDFALVGGVGYPDGFESAEHWLAERGTDGAICRDADGRPRLECTCGLVIQGLATAALGNVTAGGSLWLNSAQSLDAADPSADPRHHPRNRCIHVGYDSVALVPVHAGDEVVGLLHLADYRPGQLSASLIGVLEGVGAMVGVAWQRRQAEEALRASADLLNQTEALTGVGGWTVDFSARQMTWTHECYRLFDLDPDAPLAGEELFRIAATDERYDPADRAKLDQALKECVVAGTPFDLTCGFTTTKGRRRWLRVCGQIDGRVGAGHVHGNLIDVTEALAAQAALTESEERFRRFFEDHTAPMALIEADSGALLDANSAAADLYGWSRDQLRTMSLHGISALPPAATAAQIQEIVARKRVHFESEHWLAAGTKRQVEVWACCLELRGRPVLHAIIHDITERHRRDAELARVSDLYRGLADLHRFVGGAADEKALLNGVCRILARVAGLKLAWVGWADPGTDEVTPVARAGEAGHCLDDLLATCGECPSPLSLTRAAIREGRYAVCNNTAADLPGAPCWPQARELCLQAAASFPIAHADTRRGALTVYADAAGYFREQEVLLLDQAASSVHGRLVRLQQQAALQATNARYEQLAQQTRSIAWEVDADGLYTYISPVAMDVFGVRPEAVVGRKHFYDLHPQRGREAFRLAALAVFAERGSFNELPNPIERPDGRVIWVSTTGHPVVADDGSLLGYRGVDRDVTDQREADALRRVMFESSMDGLLIVGSDGGIVEANDAYAAMSGYSVAELKSLTLHDMRPPDDVTDTDQHTRDIRAVGAARFDSCHRRKDGTLYDVEISARYLPMGDGLYFGFVRDITARKQAEAALRESEGRFRAYVEQAAGAIFVHDRTGRFLDVNQQACAALGYTRDELLCMSVHDVECGFSLLRAQAEWDEVRPGSTTVLHGRHRRKDGSSFPIEARLGCFELKGERCFLALVLDTSERQLADDRRRRMEAQLLQAQKMESVGLLAGGVAHDFNNMLGVMLGYAELIRQGLDATDPLVDDIIEIQSAGERAAELTQQLLTFARKQEVQPVLLDVNETIEAALKMLRRLIGEDIDLRWLPGAATHPVRMDPGQLHQVLANLCVNARDAIGGAGTIIVETGMVSVRPGDRTVCIDLDPGAYTLLRVTDDGAGMDAATLARVFEPFFTTKALGRGTGLGLAMVYGIVQQNGGAIDATSEPGAGTAFTIYLPCTAQATNEIASDAAGTHPRPPGGTESILLVEDETAMLRLTELILKRLGYQVSVAASPSEALRIAEQCDGPIDLLLSDVVMPDLCGPDLAERLRLRFPMIRVLFVSGYTDDLLASRGLQASDLLLAKPFTELQLAGRVRQSLDEPPPSGA